MNAAVELANVAPVAASDALVSRITAVRLSLRPSEQRVAAYVLGQPNRVAHMAIAELAEAVGVTDPTIARFCQALGFTGYKAFKVALAKSLATGVPYVHTDVSAQDSCADVIAKVFDRSIATLIAMRNQVDPKVFERAADAITGTPEDVVVAISRTGRTRDMIQTCELAQRAGATVIAVTERASQLAKLADIALAVDVDEDPDVYSPMVGRLAQLALVDALAVAVALKRGPELQQTLRRAKETLVAKREKEGDMLTPLTLAARSRWI